MLDKLKRFIRKTFTRCECFEEKNQINIEIKKYLDSNSILIDVRSPQEYKEGHFENAILIPDYEIYAKAKAILKDKNQKVILYCNTGRRSENAGKILKAEGYINVYNICNGIHEF